MLWTPGAPWQRAYIERLIGTMRRECLDRVIVVSERDLCHHLRRFVDYYHRSRTHLGLQKDAPDPRAVQRPEGGRIVAFPEVVACTIDTSAARPEETFVLGRSADPSDFCSVSAALDQCSISRWRELAIVYREAHVFATPVIPPTLNGIGAQTREFRRRAADLIFEKQRRFLRSKS